MRRWLESVCDDTLHLNLRIPDNYGWDHGHNHAKVSGSPALIRLEPLALVDPRTGPVEEASADYEENQAELRRSIPFTVCSWALLFAEEHDLKSDVSTMDAAVTLLLAQWEALVGSLWVDDFYADMSKIKQALNRAHNYRPPVEIGPCFRCDNEVRKEDGNGEDAATCQCGRVYEGSDLFKLHLQKNRDRLDGLVTTARLTIKDARDYLRLKYPQHPAPRESTIRSWVSRGQVSLTEEGFVDILSMEKWFTELRDHRQASRRTSRTG
jgi:hypothetical protein